MQRAEEGPPAERAQPRAPGRIERHLIQWLMRSATVAAVETLSPGFQLITFEGDALRNLDWSAGQKIQITMGRLFGARTYTPISWDIVRGVTRILTCSHGEGPGSSWATTAAIGKSCQFLGPRSSLNLADLPRSTVLFGDETGVWSCQLPSVRRQCDLPFRSVLACSLPAGAGFAGTWRCGSSRTPDRRRPSV